jgi:hypothetical protein
LVPGREIVSTMQTQPVEATGIGEYPWQQITAAIVDRAAVLAGILLLMGETYVGELVSGGIPKRRFH